MGIENVSIAFIGGILFYLGLASLITFLSKNEIDGVNFTRLFTARESTTIAFSHLALLAVGIVIGISSFLPFIGGISVLLAFNVAITHLKKNGDPGTLAVSIIAIVTIIAFLLQRFA